MENTTQTTTTQTTTTAGIDVGTSAVKVAIVRGPVGTGRHREGSEILCTYVDRIRRRDQREVINEAYQTALSLAGLGADEVGYVATTGEGELVDFRVGHFYGMTAHARGAVWLEPEARGVLDIGALHARAIKMSEHSRVESYRMTSQCASGSGQFLENIARYLGVTLDEVGELSKQADAPEQVSSICAVLAETDVINMVSRGITLPNILKGIHESMAGRFAKLMRATKTTGVVLVTGGLAKDEGLLDAIEQALAKVRLSHIEIRTHALSEHAGALGAALWGAFRHERLQAAA